MNSESVERSTLPHATHYQTSTPRETFEAMDLNHDGVIDRREFMLACEDSGNSTHQLGPQGSETMEPGPTHHRWPHVNEVAPVVHAPANDVSSELMHSVFDTLKASFP